MLTRPVSLVDNLLELFAFMVEADKVLDPQELQYMNKYLHFYYPTSTAEEYFKIFEKKVNDLFAGADPEGKKLQEILKEIANAYDYADKFFLLLTLFKIASVDGIAETEEKFLRNVAERLSVKQDDLNYLFNMFTGSTFETATRFLKFSGTPEKTDIFYPGIDVEFIVFEVAKAYLIFNRTGKDSVKLNQQHLKPGFALRFFRDQILEVGAYAIPIQLLQKFFVAKYNEVGDIHCFLENKKGEQGLSVAFHKSNASIAELEIKNNINKLTPLKQGGGCKVNDAALMEASYINLGDRISVDGILVDFTGLLSDFIYNRQYVSYAGKKDLLIDFPGTIHDLNFKIEGEKVYVVPTGRLNQIYVNDELVSSQREVGANDLIYCNKTITRVDPTKNLISTGPFKFKKIRSAEVKFVFKTKQVGLDNVTFEIAQNELVCVMGPSGCGKSTLLNIMNGYMLPTTGNVMIDGYDFFKQHDAYKDHVGYVPQDDLLFETLTVFENLYYNCSLRFPSKSEEEKKRLIIDVLTKVGLASKRDTKVGNPLEKTLSGGERKRVNIALELLSGVSILFLDEPTSGLSSKDSEKIVSLLRQIADEGKMVFVVIHQPSSKLYRTFDKLILLDKGGKLAFFGPVQDALVYFKKHRDSTIEDDAKLDPNHIEPEILLEALEEPLLDLDGSPLDERKYSPDYWKDRFKDYSKTLPRYEAPAVEEKAPLPPIRWSGMVERFTQLKMLLARSFKTLFRNRSNLLISFIEAPLLGFLISLILRYDSKYDHYSLYNNELLTSWMFLTVVVVLFLGMTNSVETIIQDRLILLRERMLNISNLSYYISKLVPLFFFSVVQNFLYLGVSFLILELRELFFEYMIITIVLSVCGISIGLFLSSLPKISSKAAFNIVPIILIPQIIFGGALIAYEDMNKSIRFYKNDPIPEISQIMPSRWAYEALMDLQGRHNNYDKESERLVQDRTTFVQTRDGFKEQFGEAMYQQKKYELETRINEHETNFRDKYGNEKVSLALKDGRQKYRAMIARDSTHSFVYPLFVPEKKLPFVGVISTVYYDTIIMIVMFALFSIGTILSLAYGAIAFDKLSALLRRA